MLFLYLPGIAWQHGSILVMQVMHWATVSATTTMAGPSALLTETMTVTHREVVVSTMVQAGGLMLVWQLIWMDGTTVGATAGWPTASTGERGTSWQMDELESATPSIGWRWRQDPKTLWEQTKDNDDNIMRKICCAVDYSNNHTRHFLSSFIIDRCFGHYI